MDPSFYMSYNPMWETDSYKLTHWQQYPEGTNNVYSYFESRPGADYDFTLFFGLQMIIFDDLLTTIVPSEVTKMKELVDIHVGPGLFNYDGWMHIATDHKGYLPLEIRAVPEGMCVPTGNVLMTVVNTCPQCYWLTNYVESLLTHVWYPSTVATVSKDLKNFFLEILDSTDEVELGTVNFMLHDFGYRGVSSTESAERGGLAHLVNFMGTDTVPALRAGMGYYAADPTALAFSVPATEHSVMTALGPDGEFDQVQRVLDAYPTGIVSVVADSYDIYAFVDKICEMKGQIMARDGRFVIRPDSITPEHDTPATLMLEIMERLWEYYNGGFDSRGRGILDPHIRVLWGDGISPEGIKTILQMMDAHDFSPLNFVFGMGGGLLQKVNRDTQQFAFKSSAQNRDGTWYDVFKEPLDKSKSSKRGRLKLIRDDSGFRTVGIDEEGDDVLELVYKDGQLLIETDFAKVRANSNMFNKALQAGTS